MSVNEVVRFYDHVKSFHDSEDFRSVIPDLDSSSLIPTLREYQVDAVKWMLHKEYQLDLDNLPQDYRGNLALNLTLFYCSGATVNLFFVGPLKCILCLLLLFFKLR